MKKTFRFNIFLLCLCGVFGDEVKSVSVMEGDSVTLNTNLTDMQDVSKIVWRGDLNNLLVEMDKNENPYIPNNTEFRDRLQVNDQTGSLTIKNMREKHSGPYKVEINTNTGTPEKIFRVVVYEAPSHTDVEQNEVKSVSVTEGQSVHLHTGIQTQRDDLILWRFGDRNSLIAKLDVEDDKKPMYYDDVLDKRFKDRLQVDHQTGDLIVTNSKTNDTGVYKLKISTNRETKYKTFSVSVSVREAAEAAPMSSGEIAAIVIGVLALCALIAVIAAVVIYRLIITKQQNQRIISLWQGNEYICHPDELQPENDPIAKLEPKNAGFDQMKIISSRGMRCMISRSLFQFHVTVKVRVWLSELGALLHLENEVELQEGDMVVWTFEDSFIARYIKGSNDPPYYDNNNERFKGRFELDENGSLTVKNITIEHCGFYTANIISKRRTKCREFIVVLTVKVKEGETVTLETAGGLNNDRVQWSFRDNQFSKGHTPLVTKVGSQITLTRDERFANRLEMNRVTLDLTITDIRQTDEGIFQILSFSSEDEIILRTYHVYVSESKSATVVKPLLNVAADAEDVF